jgi:adenylyltransferase/sulfurtransferase
MNIASSKVSTHSSEPIVIDDDRYSRLRLIGWWDQAKIANAKVMVVGAGALGNEVLKNLALLGLGNVYLIDFDTIQDSNLTRSVLFRQQHCGQSKAKVAAAAAMELNSDCKISAVDGDVLSDVGLGLVRDVDLVICCVDNREARLWINRMCWKVNTPWIDGGIQEINGVAKVFRPPAGACYECAMTENDYRLISLRYSCPLLKKEDVQQGKVPTAPTIASIVGGLQVQEALKLIHDLPVEDGQAMVFNGAANNFYKTRFVRREDCLSHETYESIIDLPIGAESHSAAQLFGGLADYLSEHHPEFGFDAAAFSLLLDRDFLVSFECRSCRVTKPVNRPRCQVLAEQSICEQCGQAMQQQSVCEVRVTSDLVDRELAELGVPRFDIVKVSDGASEFYVSLNADRFQW